MRMRNINLALFSVFLAILIALPILCVDRYLSHPDVPWQLVPFNADSLSLSYKEKFTQLKSDALILSRQESSKPIVMVLVDGWGLPYDESLLESDYAHFDKNKSFFAVHKRLLQRTSYAENAEYKQGFAEGVLLMNGDSTACAKSEREQGHNFKQTICCEGCDDTRSMTTLDSLILLASDSTWNEIAWTVHGTREGDRNKLDSLLKNFDKIARKHPDIQFIIQGAHRPLLGPPEIRRKYIAPWVPAVFINCLPKTSAEIGN